MALNVSEIFFITLNNSRIFSNKRTSMNYFSVIKKVLKNNASKVKKCRTSYLGQKWTEKAKKIRKGQIGHFQISLIKPICFSSWNFDIFCKTFARILKLFAFADSL